MEELQPTIKYIYTIKNSCPKKKKKNEKSKKLTLMLSFRNIGIGALGMLRLIQNLIPTIFSEC